ncbi:acyl-CoA dehydrogenase family protein [Pseudonocardia alaniniphila]|uniref:Hydroxylase n=1 Tax=Pseudonocardia alaniniphila TaxID=75291 RepID=A0ABS9TPJ1_9PSEU|nr:acyl-CoA dehydrogenase family protein [Pseudonocardia alaniniphila]MCH6170474.1 hydroxylase [Pseudonocardia alaniniphila]
MTAEEAMTASETLSDVVGESVHVELPAAAAALAPHLSARAPEASAIGTLPADVVELLEAAGMFRLGLPLSLGGFEADPATLVRTAETLAHADGSAAWAAMTGNSSMFFAWLDQSVAARLLDGRPGQPVSSSFAPTGQAVEEDGGYRVSGRWSFVSGAPHATMISVGVVVVGPDGVPRTLGERPMMRWAVLPATELQVLPTWNDAAGLRGSGSHDVLAEGVFVPAERTLMPFYEPPRAGGALYRVPFFTAVRSLLVGIPLGVARRALDELTELCRHKTREMAPLVQDQDVQVRLAEAEAALRAGRSFLLDVTERTWSAVQSGVEVPLPLRTEYALAAQFATRSAVQAVNLAFETAGVSSALAGDVIQRCWRDVNVAGQHIAFSRGRWRGAGQALLGLEIDPFHL